MNTIICKCLAIRYYLVPTAIAALLSGCTLMLGDTIDSQISKLTPSTCPNLSGKYALSGTTLEKIPGLPDKKKNPELLLIGLLPSDQEETIDNIYEFFFDLNRPYRINIRKELMPTLPRRLDYFEDINKTNGAYAKLKETIGNEYIVNVYSKQHKMLGSYKTKLLGNGSICHDGKYYSISDDSVTAGPVPDGFFTMARGRRTTIIYRSIKGEFIISQTYEIRKASLGVFQFSEKGTQNITSFSPIVD